MEILSEYERQWRHSQDYWSNLYLLKQHVPWIGHWYVIFCYLDKVPCLKCLFSCFKLLLRWVFVRPSIVNELERLVCSCEKKYQRILVIVPQEWLESQRRVFNAQLREPLEERVS